MFDGLTDLGANYDFGYDVPSVLDSGAGIWGVEGLGDWGYDFSNGFEVPTQWGFDESAALRDAMSGGNGFFEQLLAAEGAEPSYALNQAAEPEWRQSISGQEAAPQSAGYFRTGLGNWSDTKAQPVSATQLAEAAEKQNPILKAMGFSANAEGTGTDWLTPKSLQQLMKLAGVAGNFINSASRGSSGNNPLNNPARIAQQQQLLQQQLAAQAATRWTPQQQVYADRLFNGTLLPPSQRTQPAAAMPSPIVPGRGYADGGEVVGALEQTYSGPAGYVPGEDGGQADTVEARLSPGEYVWDADVVSALGDGNNAAGAKILDAARQRIREHKRSAPADKIPPPAHELDKYLNGEN